MHVCLEEQETRGFVMQCSQMSKCEHLQSRFQKYINIRETPSVKNTS